MSAFVTILISIYNNESTLDRCLQSLKDQTFQDFTILCIDDCSTDRSLTVLKKWQQIFGERFTLIQNTDNLGLTKSLNTGLRQIITPYTARLDGDDWWHPEKLQRQYEFIQEHPEVGLLGTAYTNIFHSEKQRTIFPVTENVTLKKSIFTINPFAHSTVFFDTKMVQSVGGYNETIYYGQDYELWLRLLPLTQFANIPEVLCYRTADSGISLERQNEQMQQYLKTQWKYLRKYRYSWKHYFHLLRPLIVLATPQWLRAIRRKFL